MNRVFRHQLNPRRILLHVSSHPSHILNASFTNHTSAARYPFSYSQLIRHYNSSPIVHHDDHDHKHDHHHDHHHDIQVTKTPGNMKKAPIPSFIASKAEVIVEEEEELEEMFVSGPAGMEWGGPTRGGRRPEPTRYGDWERKGRCSDF